jgi:hypothetical protein
MRKIIFIASLLFSLSCDKIDINTQLIENATVEEKEYGTSPDDGEMILSDKVTNPYEIKNMQRALKSMKQKVTQAKDIEIEPNYKYVRFLPSSRGEYDLINGNPDIDVFEYPLDRKIIKKGNKYIDKSLGNSEFGWIYSAVPIDMKFDSKIKMEVIDLLFLPDGNGRTDEYSKYLDSKGQSHKNLMKELEKESINIHGDEKYGLANGGKSAKIADWYSSGRIRVWDERLKFDDLSSTYIKGTGGGWLPVPGCQVRANRWFTTKTQITNYDGTFVINHWWPSGSYVDMDIKWDRTDFDIRTGSYGQAITSNQNIIGPWNPNISESVSPDHYIYAHVHRAAYQYYYDNTFGIQRPPSANFPGLGGKMHLGAKQGSGTSHYFAFNAGWSASEIKLIFNLTKTDPAGDDNIHDGRGIFATTIHELTHASHWTMGMDYIAYASNAGQAGRLAESWAQAVGWHITRQVYSSTALSLTANILTDTEDKQLMALSAMNQTGSVLDNDPWYTPLFIDLIDDYNQGFFQGAGRPTDTANGFFISTLQSYLIQRPNNWYMYRDYLNANSTNPTKANAVQLFSDYD